MSGKLFIIGTPIGNLEDISPRVKSALSACDLILAEDTRVSIKLLNHLGLKKKMLSCHKFNEHERLNLLSEANSSGQSIALISDAGMPLVSDPGHPICQLAIEIGMEIIPIAGPSAFLLALVGSGLPLDKFVFEGFLPDKTGELTAAIAGLAGEKRTSVFYVSPHKIERTLQIMLEHCGDRPACLARELTKLYEEFIRGTLSSILSVLKERPARGECVLVLGGCREIVPEMDDWQEDEAKRQIVFTYIDEAMKSGLKLSQAAAEAARKFNISRSHIYREVLNRHQ